MALNFDGRNRRVAEHSPFMHISIDQMDPEPITPNHFPLGRAAPHIPPDIFIEGELVSRKE